MSRYEQDGKVASVKIDGEAKKDDLLLSSMFGIDRVGQPFSYTVEMLENADAKIDLSKTVGKILTIKLKVGDEDTPVRHFSGYIADMRHGGLSPAGLPVYVARVVPRIYFLNQVWHSRIFRNKTPKDILNTIFKSSEPAFKKFSVDDISTTPKLPTLEHCVQYNETDYAFVHRLMEEYGISYYFKHSDGEHEMVLLNSSGKRPVADQDSMIKELAYFSGDYSDDYDIIRRWERRRQVVTDAYERTDFNFASTDMFPSIFTSEAKGDKEQGDFKAESFKKSIYEPSFEEGIVDPHKSKTSDLKDASEKVAEVRLGAFQAQKDLVYAESDSRKVHAGYVFKLDNYEIDDKQNGKEYYVTEVRHQINVSGYGVEEFQSGKPYFCEFTAIPKETEYYPLQTIPKARIYGPQTATVVSEEATDKKLVYTDQQGRIKICFHWDLIEDRKSIDEVADTGKDDVDKQTKNLSCWVRVSQGWAGNKWGSFFLPRVGQEVIVEFLDGDPDRPIVTGSVYNGMNVHPYKLPDHKTISTIKSENITKDGEKAETATYNEIRFEDREDSEQIFIHAGRAMDTRVLGDHRTHIGNNMQLTIDGSNEKDFKDKSDDDSYGHRDVVLMKGHDQLTLVGGNLIQEIKEGHHLLDITKGGQMINIGENLQIKVAGKILISADDVIHIKSAKSLIVDAEKSISFKAGKDITFQAKGGPLNLEAGKKILAKGKSGIELGGDSSSVVIAGTVGIKGGSGVTIDGSSIDMNGGKSKAAGAPGAPLTIVEPELKTPKDLKVKVGPALAANKDNEEKDIALGEIK